VLYFCYVWVILDIDFNELNYDTNRINSQYLAANIIHFVNAVLYIWCWVHEGWALIHFIMIPEVLNMCEASLYISSSLYYPQEGYSNYTYLPDGSYIFINDPVIALVQRIEFAASLISCFAAFGWCFTWWYSYPRLPGRGFTLDDPDIAALFTIVLGAFMYLGYNAYILHSPDQYGTFALYIQADYLYAVNGILYLITAIRDCGWFYWGPVGGVWNFYDKFEWKGNEENEEKEDKEDKEEMQVKGQDSEEEEDKPEEISD